MRILVIEDERRLAETLATILREKHFEVDLAFDGESGEAYAKLNSYDLLILDVMLPGVDGFELARRIRARRCGVPILVLTAKSELGDRIEGLNAGADYYLTKPFDTGELLACVHALLRRHGSQVDVLSFGGTELDLDACSLVCGEKSVRLSAREFDVMRLLMQAGERNISKELILFYLQRKEETHANWSHYQRIVRPARRPGRRAGRPEAARRSENAAERRLRCLLHGNRHQLDCPDEEYARRHLCRGGRHGHRPALPSRHSDPPRRGVDAEADCPPAAHGGGERRLG